MTYIHPQTHELLTQKEDVLLGERSGVKVAIENALPIFLTGEDLTGPNARYERLYNRFALFYDFFVRNVYRLMKKGGEEAARREYLEELELKEGDRVLEVSVGTGGNLKFLPKNIPYYGIDISRGMLKVCQKNIQKWGMNVELCLGAAEYLPYQDNFFDAVFHVGGINFFNDKAKAVHEMIRVAKPGSKILIVDETVKGAKTGKNVPGGTKFYRDQPEEAYDTPIVLLPAGMQEVRLKMIDKGRLYCLIFRKP